MESEFLLKNNDYLEAIVRERKEKEKSVVDNIIAKIENGKIGVGVIDNGYKLYFCECVGQEYSAEIVKIALSGLPPCFGASINGMSVVDEDLRMKLWEACRNKVAESEKSDE